MEEAIETKETLSKLLCADKKKSKNLAWLLLVPATVYIIAMLVVPMFGILMLSFQDKDGSFSLANYQYIIMDPTVRGIFLETCRISFLVMAITLVLGYPLAYVMTICSKKTNAIITLCIMIPFWTSLLIRTYAWTALLQNKGVINNILISIGLIKDPINMCYNTTGVLIGMTYVMLPFMVLSLYSVMEGIDRNLITASENLGANGIKTFTLVYFPLSLNGVISGSVLVFVLNLGFYIIPALMGSPKNTMVSQFIAAQVNKLLNWNMAAALSFVLLLITMILISIVFKVFKINKLM